METLIFISLLFLFLWAVFWLPILGVLSKKKEVKSDIARQVQVEVKGRMTGRNEEWKKRMDEFRKGKKSFETY